VGDCRSVGTEVGEVRVGGKRHAET
jgi:hypothetical protein